MLVHMDVTGMVGRQMENRATLEVTKEKDKAGNDENNKADRALLGISTCTASALLKGKKN